MTITLTPEIEQALTEEAKEADTDLERLALDRLRAAMGPKQTHSLSEEERQARVRAARGSLAYLGPSSLRADKAAEKRQTTTSLTPSPHLVSTTFCSSGDDWAR